MALIRATSGNGGGSGTPTAENITMTSGQVVKRTMKNGMYLVSNANPISAATMMGYVENGTLYKIKDYSAYGYSATYDQSTNELSLTQAYTTVAAFIYTAD